MYGGSTGVMYPGRASVSLATCAGRLGFRLRSETQPKSSPRGWAKRLAYLLRCLHSHAPVDLLVIYLGTNDAPLLGDPELVAWSIGRLIKVTRTSEA